MPPCASRFDDPEVALMLLIEADDLLSAFLPATFGLEEHRHVEDQDAVGDQMQLPPASAAPDGHTRGGNREEHQQSEQPATPPLEPPGRDLSATLGVVGNDDPTTGIGASAMRRRAGLRTWAPPGRAVTRGGLGGSNSAHGPLEPHGGRKWGLSPCPFGTGQEERDPDQREKRQEPNGQELFPKL